MGGGLMQLVAYGAQDIYLTGNPQITFFKVVYRRHTNFSMETIQQTMNGTSSTVTDNSTATCTISRNGDLVHKVYVTAEEAGVTNGSALVKEVELEIGGQRIDRHYMEWNQVWNELTTPESKGIALKSMQNDIGASVASATQGKNNLTQIPLNFWFCRNPGLALPLIALQYHEVKLKFTWNGVGTVGVAANPKVWCDYIYLDTDERRRFAQVSHEYLIEQLQKQDTTVTASGAQDIKLNFNHPVKELIWTYAVDEMLTDVKLVLNGHDRFAVQKEEYFSQRQTYDYHTAVPNQNLPTSAQVFKTNIADHTFTVPTLGPDKTDGNLDCSNAIYSLGDQAPTAQETGTGAESAGQVGLAHYTSATGVLTLAAGALTSTLADSGFSVGGQIAIIPTCAGVAFTAADVTLSTGAATEGQVFFATIVSAVAATDLLKLTITKPALSGTPTTTITKLEDATNGTVNVSHGAATQVAIFIVNSASDASARTSKMTRKIGVYSFALKPEEHQPSGTCNFSRIDNAKLNINPAAGSDTITIYAVNYNVLRIMSGMGGLAYSN
jgi:hypothetical protein